jgi:hypothetical protein
MMVIQGSGMLCEIYLSPAACRIKGWPARERIELLHLIPGTGHHLYHTVGFDREKSSTSASALILWSAGRAPRTGRHAPGLFKSAASTLAYMRQNRTQAEIGESLGVSQPTISRAISAITLSSPKRCANSSRPPTTWTRMPSTSWDGTPLPCWAWAGHKELYSGKHKITGMRFSQRLSADHLVLELCEDEHGFADVADRGRADADVLDGAPSLGHQREAASALVAQGPQQRVTGSRVDAGFAAARLLHRDVHARAGPFVAGTGEDRQVLREGPGPRAGRARGRRSGHGYRPAAPRRPIAARRPARPGPARSRVSISLPFLLVFLPAHRPEETRVPSRIR